MYATVATTMRRTIWLAAIMALALVTGCTKKTDTTDGGGADGTSGEFKVGVILPLSGDLANYGQTTLAGVDLRVKELNAAGGINGQKVVLVVEDNKGQQADTLSAYKKLSTLSNVSVVIGPITSTNTMAVAPTTSLQKVVVVSPTATNDLAAPMSDYVFRTCFTDGFQGQVVATYAYRDLGLRKAAIFTETGNDYSMGLGANFKKTFAALGGQLVAEKSYNKADKDFGPQLEAIKASGAEVVFVPGYPGEVPLILKQAAVKDVQAVFCGSDGWDNEEILQGSGDTIVGSFMVGAFSADDQRAEVQTFVKAIKQEITGEPGFFEAQGYDTMSVIAEAAKSGSGREDIRSGLLKIKGMKLVTGTISIQPNGDATKSAVVLQVGKEGESYIKSYVKTVDP